MCCFCLFCRVMMLNLLHWNSMDCVCVCTKCEQARTLQTSLGFFSLIMFYHLFYFFLHCLEYLLPITDYSVEHYYKFIFTYVLNAYNIVGIWVLQTNWIENEERKKKEELNKKENTKLEKFLTHRTIVQRTWNNVTFQEKRRLIA